MLRRQVLADMTLYIIGVRRTSEALEKKKTSPKIWWIRKVVVPLHSQLKREGCPSELGDPTGQRCLTQFLERCTASSFGGFLLQQLQSFSRGFPLLEGLSKKNFPEYLVVSKTCCTFALTTRKKKQIALHV